MRKGLAAGALALLAAGCATVNDAVRDKEHGTVKEYAVSQDDAWRIAKAVFRWEGSDAIEEHREEGYMITSSGTDALTYGTVMAAWVEPGQGGQSRVTVVTKRRYQVSLFTTLTESTFHSRFAQAVEILKSGKPLPAVPPRLSEKESKAG